MPAQATTAVHVSAPRSRTAADPPGQRDPCCGCESTATVGRVEAGLPAVSRYRYDRVDPMDGAEEDHESGIVSQKTA